MRVQCRSRKGNGHGYQNVQTKLHLYSIQILSKSPVEEMLSMMDEDTYGVGYLEKTAYDDLNTGEA